MEIHRNVLVNYLHKKKKGKKGANGEGGDDEEDDDDESKQNFRKNRESNFVKDHKKKEKEMNLQSNQYVDKIVGY